MKSQAYCSFKHTSLGHRLARPAQQKTGHPHRDLPEVPTGTAELFAPQPAGILNRKGQANVNILPDNMLFSDSQLVYDVRQSVNIDEHKIMQTQM